MMSDLVCVSDYEKRAASILGKMENAFLSSGADDEITLRENEEAFKRIRLHPRMLRDVSVRDMKTSLLGHPVSMPIGVAPSGFHGIFSPEAEIAAAKAARDIGCCFIMSVVATRSIEEIHDAASDSFKWLQIYFHKNRLITRDIIRRAGNNGFRAVVLTVDTPIPGKRRKVSRTPLVCPPHVTTPMLPPDNSAIPGVGGFDASGTWEDIWWLKKESGLPVVVKGILTAEDTELAVQHGADAVYVSNHGGRQLDTVQASIDALPEVVAAARGRVEVYLDGGVRTGTDVLKALALGARAVFLGRPVIWGLVCKGQQGIQDLLSLLQEELSSAMALSGCRTLADIDKSIILHAARL